MSHQAQGRDSGSRDHHQDLKRALRWLLKGARFSGVAWRDDCQWSICGVVMTAILWAWSGETSLGDRFGQAQKVGRKMLGSKEVPKVSYQAFMKLLCRWTASLLAGLTLLFRQRMEVEFADRWKIGEYIVFAADGSRFELPLTVARYCQKLCSVRGNKSGVSC